MLEVVGFGFLTSVLAYLGVANLRRWAERRKILDIPSERSSHSHPTPRSGGIAIVVISLFGLIAFWLLDPTWPLPTILTYITSSVLIAAASFLDVLYSLPK